MFSITRSPFDFFGGSWTPAQLSNLRQWLSDSYYSSPVSGLQVIESLETHGTVRAPRAGRKLLFDGINDYLSGGDVLPFQWSDPFTLCCRIKTTNSEDRVLVAKALNTGTYAGYYLGVAGSSFAGKAYFGMRNSGSAYITVHGGTVVNDGAEHQICITNSGTGLASGLKIYVDGVLETNTVARDDLGGGSILTAADFTVGSRNSGGLPFDGSIWDVRVYSVAKDADFAASYAANDYVSPDQADIEGGWWGNDEAGTTIRDWTTNGKDLTANGPITEVTFHATDSAITTNAANIHGYTLSGSTIIPITPGQALDVLGGTPTYTGLSPYPVRVDTPCVTLDGINDYAEQSDTLSATSWTISAWVKKTKSDNIYFVGTESTGYKSIGLFNTSLMLYDGSNVIFLHASYTVPLNTWTHVAVKHDGSGNFTGYVNGLVSGTGSGNGWSLSKIKLGTRSDLFTNLEGSLAGVKVHSSAKSDAEVLAMFQGFDDRTAIEASWKCQEGPGTSSTNVTLYDDSGNGHNLTLTNATVATAWGTLCHGYVKDHAIEYGGRLGTLGEFVPLVPGTALCADGNAPTLLPGHITNNPYSRADCDPFDAAELGALNVPSEFDSLPCVTGNGTNNYIDFSTALMPATNDFAFGFDFYQGSSSAITLLFDQRSVGNTNRITISTNVVPSTGVLTANAWGLALEGGATTIDASVDLVVGSWHRIYVTRVGNLFTLYLNGVSVGSVTVAATIDVSQSTHMLKFRNNTDYWTTGRVSNFSITTGGTTKLFPLTEGSGADIAMYEAGVATIISNAIQGTLTNVWSNKTEGNVDHTFPEAMRAILPRDTKFTNGTTKTITTSEAATGADLANILEYIG